MNKRFHLLNASAVVILMSFIAKPAFAFDETNWTWTLTRSDTMTSTSASSLTALPTGNATVEARQILLGNPYSESDASATVLPSATFDGPTGLGKVESDALAYGNVHSASGEIPLTVSLGQYHVGGIDATSGATPSTADPTAMNGNHAYADKMITDAAAGLYTSHETSATANATSVQDATAASMARAVSNSSSTELAYAPAEPVSMDAMSGVADPSMGYVTNAMLASDVTQLSIGHVDSHANTSVSISGYENLGQVDRPIALASATSIGNLATTIARQGTLDMGVP
jgi:hypothetical protein